MNVDAMRTMCPSYWILIAVISTMLKCAAEADFREVNNTESRVDEYSVRRLYDKIFAVLNSPAEYDRKIRPFLGEKPLEVTVFMRVLSLRSISEATMDYRLELFFREKWQDPRLSYDAALYDNLTEISLHESLTERLWMPDTFIPNAVKSRNPNRESVTHRSLLRLHPDGSILFSRRLSITAECPMDLTLYPFDQQVCVLSIESYGHGVKELFYAWREVEPIVLDNLQLPDYQLKRTVTRSHNVTVATGTYSRLECCFFFVRSAGFYFIQLFLPATAIVFTSWILLCMGRGSNFSDMIEIILAVTFLYFSYTSMMPRVSYVKAMDIYLGACFIHVFLSMAKMAATKFHEAHVAEEQISAAVAPASTNNKSRSELSPERTPNACGMVRNSDQEASVERFLYVPTHSSTDVMGPLSTSCAPSSVSKAASASAQSRTSKETACAYWRNYIFRRLVATVARVPNSVILFSFLIFWACYLMACFWLAVDTNEDRCQFA